MSDQETGDLTDAAAPPPSCSGGRQLHAEFGFPPHRDLIPEVKDNLRTPISSAGRVSGSRLTGISSIASALDWRKPFAGNSQKGKHRWRRDHQNPDEL